MGLDMYLYEVVWTGDDLKVELSKPSQGKTRGALQELAYWRKAWMIHHWFEENCCQTVSDTGYSRIYGAKLIELKELCKKVISLCTKKQKEYLKLYEGDSPDLTPKQKLLCVDILRISGAYWSPLEEIYNTYEVLKDIEFEEIGTYLYWPWW